MTDTHKDQYPSARYGWYIVVMLTIAYVFSFVDRYILGLLIEPIKADLGLTDTQIGWLIGPAFGWFYIIMGLPLGYLADRKRRTWLLAAGVAVWSIATAASGLARNFTHMLLARFSIGAGEATLSPCAMSMISDSFPPEERGKPIAFYTMALSLGAGIASLVGAGVLTWAKSVPEISLPIVGQVAAWQFTFILVGLPGLLIAVMLFFMREPKRVGRSADDADSNANIWDMLKYVGQRWHIYGSFVIFVCLMVICAYSQGFYAPMFQRTWGWEAQQYGFVNALVLLSVAPLTVNLSGWLSDKLYAKGKADAPLIIVLIGAFILVPTAIIAPLMPSAELAFVVLAVNTVGIAMTSATGVTALLNITPGEIRGQTVALYYMVISTAGLMLPAPIIGYLSDNVFGNENLRYAVATIPAAFGLLILPFAWYARRAYNAELAKISASD